MLVFWMRSSPHVLDLDLFVRSAAYVISPLSFGTIGSIYLHARDCDRCMLLRPLRSTFPVRPRPHLRLWIP